MATSHDEPTDAPSVLSFGQLARKMWFLWALSATFNITSRVPNNLLSPYLYTRVYCCQGGRLLPKKYDIVDPAVAQRIWREAAVLGLEEGSTAACDVPELPRSSLEWSLSPTCSNKAYVQDEATGIAGQFISLQKGMMLVILPLCSTISDTAGRKVVLTFYACAAILAGLLLVTDTQLDGASAWRDLLVYIAGILLGGASEGKDALIIASMNDVTGYDAVNKTRAAFQLYGFYTMGTLAAFVLAAFVAGKKLVNYFVPWVILTAGACLALFQCLVTVKETLPAKFIKPWSWRRLNPLEAWRQSFATVCSDPVIILFAMSEALTAVAYEGYMSQNVSFMLRIGFSAGSTMLMGILGTVAEVVCSFVMMPVIVWVGNFGACMGGQALFTIGYLLAGPAALYWPPVAFLGYSCLSCAVCIYVPAKNTIVSQRVQEEHQGKCIATLFLAYVVGGLVAAPIYGGALFSATSTGHRLALPEYVSAAVSLCSLLLNASIPLVARRTPPPSNLPKEALARLEDSTANSKMSPHGYGSVEHC